MDKFKSVLRKNIRGCALSNIIVGPAYLHYYLITPKELLVPLLVSYHLFTQQASNMVHAHAEGNYYSYLPMPTNKTFVVLTILPSEIFTNYSEPLTPFFKGEVLGN